MSRSCVLQITFFLATVTFGSKTIGQHVLGCNSHQAVARSAICSVQEFENGKPGRTLHYNSQGYEDYFRFKVQTFDLNGDTIIGEYGMRKFEYDAKGNRIRSFLQSYEPVLDTTFNMSVVEYEYVNGRLMKRLYYDSPSSQPTTYLYLYQDTTLKRIVKMTSPLANAELQLSDTVVIESRSHDDQGRLIELCRYSNNNLSRIVNYTYSKNTTRYETIIPGSVKSEVVYKIISKNKRRIVMKFDNKILRWYYSTKGLLLKKKVHYLNSGNKTVIKFDYRKCSD